jgi:hypothetical protein
VNDEQEDEGQKDATGKEDQSKSTCARMGDNEN